MEFNEEPMDDVDPLAARDAASLRPQAPNPQRTPRRRRMSPQGGSQVYGSIVNDGMMAARVGSAVQGGHLGGMINQVHGAIKSENNSRVEQARELRRMQHETAIAQMELDALLARLDQARMRGVSR